MIVRTDSVHFDWWTSQFSSVQSVSHFSLLEFRAVPAQVSLEDSPPFPCALSRDMLPHSPHRLCEVKFRPCGFLPAHTPAPACGRGRVSDSFVRCGFFIPYDARARSTAGAIAARRVIRRRHRLCACGFFIHYDARTRVHDANISLAGAVWSPVAARSRSFAWWTRAPAAAARSRSVQM